MQLLPITIIMAMSVVLTPKIYVIKSTNSMETCEVYDWKYDNFPLNYMQYLLC